ncbi:cytochrome b/b6 domain-containing protein [Variovorax sp. J22R133]|uniref:cytochrome b/b6 domain-containing protein n=1 Tax=Variovorax brevis TaxID=3053503 RepID=UPI0025756A29|nr:cytochrome b/b6 domain-containing protein [Variovorax sp. J22R133]MDM0115159.1 cytochrome b/b6 domain-containing protein [Variovorax sp. J22R133]
MSQANGSVKVWDLLQRVLHWGLVASIALCWWAGEERLSLHIACGYVVLAIAGSRSAWGWIGSRHARFASFVHGPGVVLRYMRDIARGEERRYLGHNPLGGWMVLTLLLCIAVVCTSGILYTTDRFWGLAWVEMTHRVSAWTLVGLVAFHLAGVVFTSWRHRENLVAAMVCGRKRTSEHDKPVAP